MASVSGTPATPKGLRHGFGVNAFQSNVPSHLVQRWLGHASLRSTAHPFAIRSRIIFSRRRTQRSRSSTISRCKFPRWLPGMSVN
jgi:integrase